MHDLADTQKDAEEDVGVEDGEEKKEGGGYGSLKVICS